MRKTIYAIAALAFVAAPFSASAISPTTQSYQLTDFGTIGRIIGGALDINEQGQVAVNLHGTGFLYDNGTFLPPGGLVNNNTSFGLSESGLLTWTQSARAVFWDGTDTTQLPTLEPGGFTAGWDINDSGHIVGTSFRSSLGRTRGFFWDGSQMHDLGSLVANDGSRGLAINNSGVIAGSAADLPARWVNGVIEALPLPATATRGTANAVNEQGHAAGFTWGQSVNDLDATLWIDGAALVLGDLDTRNSTNALGMNDLGDVVGEAKFSGTSGNLRAFYYHDGQMLDLTDLVGEPGWILEQAYEINNRGQIVGVGRFNGDRHAFLVTPIPEPSAITILTGLALLGGVSWRYDKSPLDYHRG